MPTPAALSLAASAVGLNETEQKAALQEYMANGGVNLDPALRAWCADFMNATLAQAGMQGTGSSMARSFLDWGQPVDQPQPGDVAVFSRGDPNGPYGHVGFFERINPDGSIQIIGGNQGDAVSSAAYPAERLLGFRRAGDAVPVNSGGADAGRANNPPSVSPQRERNPLRLAWAYRHNKMTPEDRALYERGIAAGVFPDPRMTTPQQSDPLEVYKSIAMQQIEPPPLLSLRQDSDTMNWPGIGGRSWQA